jgi:hypothetical protein
MKVIKVRILAVEKIHFGGDGHETVAGFAAAERVTPREAQMGFAKEIIEKNAREDGVERIGGWARERSSLGATNGRLEQFKNFCSRGR